MTASELGDRLAVADQRVARLNPKRRREYAVRLVQRAEIRQGISLLKKAGGRISISGKAIELLLPTGDNSEQIREAEVDLLRQEIRLLRAKLNAQGAQIRDHGRQLAALRENRQ